MTAWVFGPAGWVLSQGAQQHPALFRALLRVAQCDLHIVGCCGGRVGRGVAQVSGLYHIDHSTLVHWPLDDPMKISFLQIAGTANLQFNIQFGKGWCNQGWAQFLQVEGDTVEALRQRDPDRPHLGGDIHMIPE
eukprot:10321789-Heterocapsa_arctica.AAC.1